jgi:hypothetical protein
VIVSTAPEAKMELLTAALRLVAVTWSPFANVLPVVKTAIGVVYQLLLKVKLRQGL